MNSAKPSKVLVHPRTGKHINAWAAAHGGGYQHSAAGLITNVFWHKSRKETNDPPHTRSHAMPLASFQKEARGVAPPPNRGVYFLERQYLSKLRPSHHAPNNDAILNVQRWLFKHICKHIRLHGRKPSLNIFPSSLSTEKKIQTQRAESTDGRHSTKSIESTIPFRQICPPDGLDQSCPWFGRYQMFDQEEC